MDGNDKLIKLYTGGDIIVFRIKAVLESQGINSLVRDDYKQGLAAGFGGGVPSAVDIFVTEEHFQRANEIVEALTEGKNLVPTYTKEQLAQTIDHAVLKPEQTYADLEENAKMCIKNKVFSMCVKPCDVKAAKELLKNSEVKVSCVLSFPHGADTTKVKSFQAEQAVEDGVDEIDMVMNIGRFLSGEYEYVQQDIKAVVEIAHAQNVIVKVIQESAHLSLAQIAKACELSYNAGADFVKTSTGFGPNGAKPEYIEAMVKAVGDKMKVKASGGIRNWETAVAYLEQGADRLGVGSTEAVLEGHDGKGNY